MNSTKGLIALEELKDEVIPSYALDLDDDGYENWVMELYETIKQDLINYEVLKEEHNKVIESTYELSKTSEKINKELEEENTKLKKVIEILKDFLCLEVYIDINNEYCLGAIDYAIPKLTQEKYNLLKEVFGNE